MSRPEAQRRPMISFREPSGWCRKNDGGGAERGGGELGGGRDGG